VKVPSDLICRWLLHVVFSGLDWGEAWFGISRDIREMTIGLNAGWNSWVALALAWMLPVASVLVAALREPSAAIAIGPWLLSLAYWFLYYADHWATYYIEQNSDPALSAALLPAFLILLGWGVVLVCAVRPWRWGLYQAFREGLDPAPLFRAQPPEQGASA
jgi:hypothetical protein